MNAPIPQHQEFIDAFRRCDIDPDSYDHAAHVRTAWILLKHHDLGEAIELFRDGLRRFTARIGQPGKYHETITWFYLLLINERMAAAPGQGWDEFQAANGDVMASKPPVLLDYYSKETLASDFARQTFVVPGVSPG